MRELSFPRDGGRTVADLDICRHADDEVEITMMVTGAFEPVTVQLTRDEAMLYAASIIAEALGRDRV